jgi:hypothetical protein
MGVGTDGMEKPLAPGADQDAVLARATQQLQDKRSEEHTSELQSH